MRSVSFLNMVLSPSPLAKVFGVYPYSSIISMTRFCLGFNIGIAV